MNTTDTTPYPEAIVANGRITWFNPAHMPPPFDTTLLLMLAGICTDDAARTWKPYTLVLTGQVKQTSPHDEYEELDAITEYQAGPKSDFLDYQFNLHDEDGQEIEDWWSDAIVAWALYPSAVAEAALIAATERQGAA